MSSKNIIVNEKNSELLEELLNILKTFDEVCSEHDLSYFMANETLRGAYTHEGFAPYSKSASVLMPRKDYERLLEMADNVFAESYHLQTPLNTPDYSGLHSRLINASGNGLDIFILDNVSDSLIARKFHSRKAARLRKLLKQKQGRKSGIFSFGSIYKRYQKKLGRCSNKKTSCAGELSRGYKRKMIWPACWFEEYCYLPFEGLRLRAPLFYYDLLRRQYGSNFMVYSDTDQ